MAHNETISDDDRDRRTRREKQTTGPQNDTKQLSRRKTPKRRLRFYRILGLVRPLFPEPCSFTWQERRDVLYRSITVPMSNSSIRLETPGDTRPEIDGDTRSCNAVSFPPPSTITNYTVCQSSCQENFPGSFKFVRLTPVQRSSALVRVRPPTAFGPSPRARRFRSLQPASLLPVRTAADDRKSRRNSSPL